jgi:RNA polymerase sigma-70 factor, ECF subfamily
MPSAPFTTVTASERTASRFRVLHDSALAEDAVQDAFVSVWRQAGTYDPARGKASTWILTLVHRRAVDPVRRQNRFNARAVELGAAAPLISVKNVDEDLPRRSEVEAALHTLSSAERQVLELAYWGGVVDARPVATECGEEQLLTELRKGDEQAFRTLVRRHTPSMTRVAMAFVSRRAVAEEVVQETWLNVVRSLDAFQARSSLRTWIYAILGNCARRRAEQEQRFVPLSEIAASEASGDEQGVIRDRFFDSGRWAGKWSTAVSRWDDLPEQRLVSSELRAALLEAIDALPRMQRAVITLRDVEDWSSEEVCNYLGLASGNQRILLHRARAAARLAIERYVEEGT